MRGGSRPGAGRKPLKNPRNQTLRVRLTERELAALEKAAAKAGTNLTTYARKALGLETGEKT